ncbi:unnamed protein product [Lymnaea stagnalis]|uniref:Protein broad-minded n=1 Tax=Lymnaea stagnalis TaxID=6523 RepID=A0AAV2HA76_LYMST
MAMRGLQGEDLKHALKELITSWNPIIKEAGSYEAAEDNLLHLEENDENFHRHDFVKALKRKLDEILSPLVDDEPERNSTAGHIDSGGHESRVNRVIDHIMESREFNDLKTKLKKNVEEAVGSLMANFNNVFEVGRAGADMEFFDPLKTPMVTDDEEGSVMLFNQDYLKGIAENLSKTKNAGTRKEAMQKLNQIISGEIVHNKHWQPLRKNLLDVMADPDDQLSDLSLKFVAKSFTHTSHYTSQVYILLIDFLCGHFKVTVMPPVNKGLDFSNKEMVKLLKAFRLMVEFQQEAPNYWVRYPLTYMEEVVQSSLNLISLMTPQAQSSKLTPLHFIAVLDPKAQWFIKWMHGNYCRRELLKHLKQYKVIVEIAVKQCMDFSNSHKTTQDGLSQVVDEMSKASISDKRTSYTGPELEYILFMHSLSFLGSLLFYEKGRSFFPIKLKEKQGKYVISYFSKALFKAQLLLKSHSKVRTLLCTYEVSSLVAEVFKTLCSTEAMCLIAFCRDDITNLLLSPVAQCLEESTDLTASAELTLLRVADILCVVASTANGRHHLLYGEGKGLLNKSKSSAAHTIAEFTKKSLLHGHSKSSTIPSNSVTGAFLYVCRQLYNTCEGLYILTQYELHTCVAEAWKQQIQKEKSNSTAPGDKGDKDSNIDSWRETLQDNLLNFASTAKGILLLHQTGAFNECVRYMYSRYEKKLQVSKCEKFGYGVMVTQVAATAAGIQALQSTGYIKALLIELWSSLECGPLDTPVFTPKSWPVDHIDRSSQKHFIRVVNILSAFPAVYELLRGEPLPCKDTYSLRDIPDTIMALIDRLIIVNSEAKIHSLFNYEQSHTFGLRLLSVMVSCLDTYLLIQSQYKFQEFLLQEQEQNKPEDSEAFITDLLSVERNYILVKTYLIGGPTERVLPSRNLEEVCHDKSGNLKAPILFSSYPIPREYQPNIAGRSSVKQENELSKFLTASRSEKKPKVWFEKCRELLYKTFSGKPDQAKGNILLQVLEQTVEHQCQVPEEAVFHLYEFSGSDSAIKNFKLSPLQLLGVKMAIRYGIHLKVINTSSESTDNLTKLMRQTGCFLKQQQRSLKSSMNILLNILNYPGFDWFTATIFLVFNGNTDKAWTFLYKLSALGTSGYIWMARLHASLLPNNLLASGIPPLFSSTAHNIELLLQTELPLVASAFKMSGYTPSQICLHWLTQCFWNYLDWLDILHYIVICVGLGVDYQVYLCVAILRHLQENILSHMQTQDLVIFLKEEAITDFHVIDEIKFMKELENKYRKIVLPDMMNMSKP